MQTLIQKFKKNRRKAKHVKFLHLKIAELHGEIIAESFKGEFQFNKGITIIYGNVENKAKLLKKYNRRLKLIVY
jgi:hypothetical protein